jgi:rhodanese-related sulfurtransferase
MEEPVALPIQRGTTEIDVDELAQRLDRDETHLVDVREDWEYRRGRVPGAIHVPLGQLPDRIRELPRDKPLLIICEHGNRSLVATHYLLARGFPGTVSVRGGTSAWVRSQRPLERD